MNDGVATPTEGTPRATGTLARGLTQPWLLALVIVGVYAISLGGRWLDYDDDWLVRDNELLTLRPDKPLPPGKAFKNATLVAYAMSAFTITPA